MYLQCWGFSCQGHCAVCAIPGTADTLPLGFLGEPWTTHSPPPWNGKVTISSWSFQQVFLNKSLTSTENKYLLYQEVGPVVAWIIQLFSMEEFLQQKLQRKRGKCTSSLFKPRLLQEAVLIQSFRWELGRSVFAFSIWSSLLQLDLCRTTSIWNLSSSWESS